MNLVFRDSRATRVTPARLVLRVLRVKLVFRDSPATRVTLVLPVLLALQDRRVLRAVMAYRPMPRSR